VGSTHKGTINSKNDKIAIIELPYGIEGIASLKTLTKEDATHSEVGEALDFKVVEFSKEDKKIVVSHSATYQSEEAVEKKAKSTSTAKKKTKGDSEGNDSGNATSSNAPATSTLGDLEALSALKEQMDAAKG
jgi:small subunit ribosomal protein S1